MGLPGAKITVQDGNLGITQQNPRAQLKIGYSSGGVANTLYGIGSPTVLGSTLGYGPMVQAAANDLEVAGGPVYCMPVAPTINDAYTYCSQTPTHIGAGAVPTFATSCWASTVLTILDSTHFQVSVGGGTTMGPFTMTRGSDQVVQGTLTAIQFSASGTVVAADTYTLNTDGTVTHAGTGTMTCAQQRSLPLDTYDLLVTIGTAGTPGTATFTYSLDAGTDTSLTVTTSTAAGGHSYYQIPNTGILIDFGTSTYVAGDTFVVKYTPGAPSNASVTAAVNAFAASFLQTPIFAIHVVGSPASAAAAQSLASTLETSLTTLNSTYNKYVRGIVHCPTAGGTSGTTGSIVLDGSGYAIVDTADTDSVVAAAFASYAYSHVGVGAGEALLVSPYDGLTYRRNAAVVAASALSSVNAGTDASAVRLGSVSNVSKLLRDEFLTPALDAARFITLRTYTGLPGVYLTNVKTMAVATSDFSRYANARVIDEACAIAYAEAVQYINAAIPTKRDGTIQEKAAQAIESEIGAALKANLIHSAPPDATAVDVTVDRTNNLLATSQLNITVSVTPFGYASTVNVTIGFKITQ